MNRLAVGVAFLGLAPSAMAQQQPPSWQEMALRAQSQATIQQMIDNSMIAALQNEIAELKAQLAKLQPPVASIPPTKGEEK